MQSSLETPIGIEATIGKSKLGIGNGLFVTAGLRLTEQLYSECGSVNDH